MNQALRQFYGLLAVVAALGLAECSSPQATTPSPSSPSSGGPTLTVTGLSVLAVGLTSQLAATYSTGAAVTSPVSWQSSRPNVATVTGAGLVTATGIGTTTVTAVAAGSTGSVTIKVEAPSAGTTVLTSCASIGSPGSYTLMGDLPATSGVCLLITNVSSVQLDCRGHVVPTLLVGNSSAVSVSNCSVPTAVLVTTATMVTVTGSNFAGLVASDVVSFTASNSVFSTPTFPVDIVDGTNVILSRDTVTSAGGGAAVTLAGGHNNQVVQTSIAGGYDGSNGRVGADDGIIVQNETNDVIQDNTISNVYDMGVEGIGIVQSTTLANNTFSNIGVAGLGSYWCTNWNGNVLRQNTVSMSPALVFVVYEVGSNCGATTVPASFTGNQFIANVFRNSAPGMIGGSPIARFSITMPGAVSDNVLQGNDFGLADGPYLSPLTGFADGGGNICGPLNPALSNFPCTGGLSSTSTSIRSVKPRR